MNHLLKSKANVCRTRAKVLGYDIEIVNCDPDNLILLVNRKREKVAALGLEVDKNGEPSFTSFMIDVRKWMWAEAEGFSRDQMTEAGSELRKTIFETFEFEDIPKLLK